MTPVSVLVVAIGGYGYYYLQEILSRERAGEVTLAGIVDPQARESRAWPDIASRGLPVVEAVEEFYGAGHRADLAVVVSPIQHHVPQSVVALDHGSNVLCDKPLGATVQEARELAAARDRSGRWVMIGYQWSYAPPIQALKRDILDGRFGRPRRFSTLCCWPRDYAYYARNHWAGRLVDPRSGRWVLDSPSNNGMAHFLHNLLYLAGPRIDRSAVPRVVAGERYRAYDLESCDTTAVRVLVEGGLEVLQISSHATEEAIEPRFRLEFDEATVTCGEDGPTIVARGRRGDLHDYGEPDKAPHFQKLFDAIAGCRSACEVVCGPEAAMSQTLAIDGLHESCPTAPAFPAALVRESSDGLRRFVPGLADALRLGYERGRLPSEMGIEWSTPGRRVDLGGYSAFPAGLGPGDARDRA